MQKYLFLAFIAVARADDDVLDKIAKELQDLYIEVGGITQEFQGLRGGNSTKTCTEPNMTPCSDNDTDPSCTSHDCKCITGFSFKNGACQSDGSGNTTECDQYPNMTPCVDNDTNPSCTSHDCKCITGFSFKNGGCQSDDSGNSTECDQYPNMTPCESDSDPNPSCAKYPCKCIEGFTFKNGGCTDGKSPSSNVCHGILRA